jgi:hypothetical protein
MSAFTIFRKGKGNQVNLHKIMNLVTDDRFTRESGFTSEFVLFPPRFEHEDRAEEPLSRLTRQQSEEFLKTASHNAGSAHFSVPSTEPQAPTPEKGLAAGVLKQAARDLRRFRAATRGLKRELYLDAYSWITANDFSWPYSFVNVCELLDLSPDVIRAEVLADASLGWLDYWTARAGRVSQKVRASFVHVFASCPKPESSEANHLASCV